MKWWTACAAACVDAFGFGGTNFHIVMENTSGSYRA